MSKHRTPGQQPGKLPKHDRLKDNVKRVGEVDDLLLKGDIVGALKLAEKYKFHPDIILRMTKKAQAKR